jgi:Mg-chelatase subunit ChlD
MMIVVSDGSETCNTTDPTPEKAMNDSANYSMSKVHIENFKICTVGFAQGSTGEAQLKAIASIGKCKYYSARNETELEQALRQIYFGNLEKQKVVINIMVWK